MNFENVMIKSEIDEEYCDIEEEPVCPKSVERSSNKSFKCGVCGHCTTSNILLDLHLKIHYLKRTHQCSVCKKTFNFITELNSHMLDHSNNGHNEGSTSSSNSVLYFKGVQSDKKPKVNKFKNNPNAPMDAEEKRLLLQYVENMELNRKYIEMEKLKSYLKSSWINMSKLFAEKDYDRPPEKLARTYIHMKNQAKIHIERFYKYKKLPRPRKVDYMFVKLCPVDFEALGLDIQEILEDFQIFDDDSDQQGKSENVVQSSEDDNIYHSMPDPSTFPEDIQNDSLNAEPITNKTKSSPESFEIPAKIPRLDPTSNTPLKNYEELRMDFLLAEEQRRKELYAAEMVQKDELFTLEMKYKKEIHEKEMEIKNLELVLLEQKLQKLDEK